MVFVVREVTSFSLIIQFCIKFVFTATMFVPRNTLQFPCAKLTNVFVYLSYQSSQRVCAARKIFCTFLWYFKNYTSCQRSDRAKIPISGRELIGKFWIPLRFLNNLHLIYSLTLSNRDLPKWKLDFWDAGELVLRCLIVASSFNNLNFHLNTFYSFKIIQI